MFSVKIFDKLIFCTNFSKFTGKYLCQRFFFEKKGSGEGVVQ